MTAREGMSVDEALFYADAWGAQEDSLGHSDLAFKALAAEVRRLRSPAPVFNMDAAVEAASCAVKRWLDWCEANDEAPCARSGATEALTAALPHLMSAAKKEGGEADNLRPDMEALRRENVELVEILKRARRELDACQSVIHLAGGFDPAYVTGAKAVIKEIDAAIAAQAGKQGGG